ncbi:MAG: hypothetical protein ACO3DQ_06110, partial [Cephaloticoccus sp.]
SIPPSTPAMGAISNLQLTGAIITDPGKITPPGPLQPTDDSEIFVDKLVNMIKFHLFTIKGTYYTLSLYPTFPPAPPARRRPATGCATRRRCRRGG